MTDEFELDGAQASQVFDLEPDELPASGSEPVQEALILPEVDPEHPDVTPQIELDGMAKPIHAVRIQKGPVVQFQHAQSLLELLESQDIPVHYQCREGYCGSCRTRLLEGEVHYTEEPIAWLSPGEILPCCCIPKSAITIDLNDH